MAEELQNLLDRIQKDGVERAEARAAKIVAEAEQAAARLREEAEAEAEALREQGAQDAEAFLQRARKSLEQAARDVVLSVGDAVTATMQELVRSDVAAALSPQALQEILVKAVESYFGSDTAAGLDILLGEDDCAALTASFRARLGRAIAGGIELTPVRSVVSGFRVAVRGENVEHDFTAEAIAESMAQLVRPQIAEIVRKAMAKEEGNQSRRETGRTSS